MFKTDLQKVQYYDKYARWNPTLGRRETWEETVERVMGFFEKEIDKRNIKNIDLGHLTEAMLNLDVLPSMRIIQMAGPALERCNVGAYNCAYLPLQDWRSLAELLYILMQGTGVGFSVENQYIQWLPVIKHQTSSKPVRTFTVEDSTEGWCNAFEYGLLTWSSGDDVLFDYSRIRAYGTPLKTKGGRASGPQPLKDLLDYTRTMLLKHQGRKLSSLNVHDLACYCGSIVQVGGVRRAAEISLSDLDDIKMRNAKNGQFWLTAPERAMANNSAVYTTKPDTITFINEWTNLLSSGTGERGIFNRGDIWSSLPIRRADRNGENGDIQFGMNPCGEIILRPYEFCNLSIAVARPDDTIDTLAYKVKLATQFGIMQSLLTDFKYIRPQWKQNCEEERLLGVDITGQMDCGLLTGQTMWKVDAVYTRMREVAIIEAERMSKLLGIPMPAAVTCVKPSGNSSQLLDVSSGLHPRYSKYYIRRLRIGASSPISKFLIDHGVPYHPEVGQPPDNPTVWVFEFPVKSPSGAITRDDFSAIQQLEQWKSCKLNFTEHNPSITIYVRDDEWLEVGAWVQKNWDTIGGISFLPFNGGVYQLAPYEAITEEHYHKLISEWPELPFEVLADYEKTDMTEGTREFSCTGDKCEI